MIDFICFFNENRHSLHYFDFLPIKKAYHIVNRVYRDRTII